MQAMEFQSTLPARGATGRNVARLGSQAFQSTLPARGATTFVVVPSSSVTFQSTLPARGATRGHRRKQLRGADFNPRSPHGERPLTASIAGTRTANFNPRSPHGERRFCFWRDDNTRDFNPRSPHGERQPDERNRASCSSISIHAPRTGSDAQAYYDLLDAAISIHAPRTGSDGIRSMVIFAASHFNPRSPHGERLR